MTQQPLAAMLTVWGLLLWICPNGSHCVITSSASSVDYLPDVESRRDVGSFQNWQRHKNNSRRSFSNETLGYHRTENMTTPKEDSGHVTGLYSLISHRGNIPTTVKSARPSKASWADGGAPVCAYRVIEGGIGGALCFRQTQLGYKCLQGDCRIVSSYGGTFFANVLSNGSALLQWTHKASLERLDEKVTHNVTVNRMTTIMTEQRVAQRTRSAGVDDRMQLKKPPKRRFSQIHPRRLGFELGCWWNGSYTQFECAGVHLGSSCRDFLLDELHENVPYRICLRPLTSVTLPPQVSGSAQSTNLWDCIEFTISPLGMQDIVIAMTTVGGAICVMLVIICLLVAYITENIMSPTTQHTHNTYYTHSHH